jgi:hypothetical protein
MIINKARGLNFNENPWQGSFVVDQLGDGHPRLGLLDEPDDLLGGESTLAHVRRLRVTDFT